MIEQIHTYFTIEMIYLWLNLGVLPFWFVLIFFPYSKMCKIFTTSIFPILVLSLAYFYVIYIIFQNGYDFLNNFKLYLSLDELLILFSDSSFLLLFWIHFLAINLFLGSWVSRDALRYSVPKFLSGISLISIYFTGPLGLVLYWFIRIFYSKKISLHD